MATRTTVRRGGVVDVTIPKALLNVYRQKPRMVFKKLEWYGIHPLPIDALRPELRELAKDYDVIAVPKAMLK